MYNLVKPLEVREKLQAQGIKMFTPREFSTLFNLNSYKTEYMLLQLIADGLLQKLKRGLYMLKTDPPSEKEIANALYRPSYLSFDYALSFYNLIPEMVYEVTSATTKATRLFTTDSLAFGYYAIKREAYAGYALVRRGSESFYIAEPEKAVVDYLYALTLGQRGLLGKRTINDRLHIKDVNPDKIRGYASLFQWRQLDTIVEKLLGKVAV